MSLTEGINYKDQTLLELVLLSILTIFEFQVRLLSKVSKKKSFARLVRNIESTF